MGPPPENFHLWGSIVRKMKASFSRRHDPDLQENLLVDLIDAVFFQSDKPHTGLVAFGKPICIARPHFVAYVSGR